MGSVCPKCGRYDDSVYVRFGGVPVCRACFVTEELLGSWLGLEPDLSPLLSSVGSSLVGSGSIFCGGKGVMGCGPVGWSV